MIACWQQPLWPNGEGTGLLNQGLWVRVPPGVKMWFFTQFFISMSKLLFLDNISAGKLLLKYTCTIIARIVHG